MRRKKYYAEPEDLDLLDEEDLGGGGASRRAWTRQLIGDLLVRWHWIALGFVLGLLGGFYYLSKAPKIYQATSTLLVKQSTGGAFEGSREEEGDINLRSKEGMATMAEQLQNLDLLEKVAQDPAVFELEGLVPPSVNWWPEWSTGLLGG